MANNKSVLIVVFCLGFSFSGSHCAQETWAQQLSNWVYKKFHQYFGAKPKVAAKLFNKYKSPALGLITGGLMVDNPVGLAAGSVGLMFVTALGYIEDILRETEKKEERRELDREREEKKRKEREKQVNRVALKMWGLISENDLFPTRSSKINLLLKKDEFVDYIDDKEGIIDQATKQLIAKYFEEDDRTLEQKEKEEKIDTYVSSLKGRLFGLPLKDQVDLLKNESPKRSTIAEIDGYNSLVGRLENKLAVENRLSPQQREKIEGLLFVANPEKQEEIKTKYKDWVKEQKLETMRMRQKFNVRKPLLSN